jgi:hypothetical protein
MVLTDTGSWRVIWALPAPVAVRAATGFLAPRVPSGRALPPRPARAVRCGQARPASRPGGLGHLDGLRQYLLARAVWPRRRGKPPSPCRVSACSTGRSTSWCQRVADPGTPSRTTT